MAKNHLKRINAPNTWPITRKATKFTIRPQPGGHPMEMSIPIGILLKEELRLCKTARSVRTLLRTQELLVNGTRQWRPDDTVGFMDLVTFPSIKTSFRILLNEKKRLFALPIAGKEATLIPCKITSKTLLKGGKLQLGFHNGRSLIVKKDEYKRGSTLLISLENKVEENIPLEKGAFVVITRGKHAGTTGVVEKNDGDLFTIKGKETVETRKQHLFVIGKGKSIIKLEA